MLKFANIFRKITNQAIFINIIKAVMIFLFSVGSLNIVYADETPNRVYVFVAQADVQAVFNNGIAPEGNNFNLMDLISGNPGDNSAYISTSANFSQVLPTVERFAEGSQFNRFVVFAVRPDDSFFGVDNSLRFSMNQARVSNPSLFMRLWLLYNEHLFNDYNGWVTTRAIPANQIEFANVYTLQDNVFVQTVFQNPNYVEGTPSVNGGAISLTGTSEQFVYYRDLGAYGILPAQLCGSFSSSSKTMLLKGTNDHGVCTQHTYEDLKIKIMKFFTLFMI